MPDIKRTVKLITEQRIVQENTEEGLPLRKWNIEIWLLNEAGEEVPANCFEKAVYKLHPTFAKPVQTIKKPPFRIDEQGWGEFDMEIILTAAHKGGDHPIRHDLNFANEKYEGRHTITFRNPKPELLAILKESGSVGEENGIKSKRDEVPRKKSRKEKNVDMEKLAEGLQRLDEDSLLQVVQMIHDNKTAETYTKNDPENGEFHVDLYTLPDQLVKMLWDYTAARTEL